MPDIVERLRQRVFMGEGKLYAEAASEIERLRMERDVVCRDAAEDIKSLRAKLAEYESAPVRLRHIMQFGRMPDADDPR